MIGREHKISACLCADTSIVRLFRLVPLSPSWISFDPSLAFRCPMDQHFKNLTATANSLGQKLARMPAIRNLRITSRFMRTRPSVSVGHMGPSTSPQRHVSASVAQYRSTVIAGEDQCQVSLDAKVPLHSYTCKQQAISQRPIRHHQEVANNSASECTEEASDDKRLLQDASCSTQLHRSNSPTSIVCEPRCTPLSSLRSESTSFSVKPNIRHPGSVTPVRNISRSTSPYSDPASSDHLTNSSIQRIPPGTVDKRISSSGGTNSSQISTSDESSLRLYHRKHVIIYGQLISISNVQTGERGTLADESIPPTAKVSPQHYATITVGARPLLQTCQGFPFDLRRSRPEASRLINLSMDDGVKLDENDD